MAEEGDQADIARAQLGREPSPVGMLRLSSDFIISIETECSIMFCIWFYRGLYRVYRVKRREVNN